jgi:hypothetical protein
MAVVGIPRALPYHRYGRFWQTYLTELGFDVKVSAKTTKQTLEKGLGKVSSEVCLPIKIVAGHIEEQIMMAGCRKLRRPAPAGRGVSCARILLLFLLACGTARVFGQWSLNLTIPNPYPSPYSSDWQSNPGIVGVAVAHTAGGNDTVSVAIRIVKTEGSVELLTGSSSDLVFTGPGMRQLSNVDFWRNTQQLKYNVDYRQQIVQTGRLLEGSYILYATLADAATGQPLGPEQSARFWILGFTRPLLVAPAYRDTIRVSFPTFLWTPASSHPGFLVRYVLRICEILSGQTPQAAINNIPFQAATLDNQTMLIYSNRARMLEEGKSYVWRVQALDRFNNPLGEYSGNSDISIFTFGRREATGAQSPAAVRRDFDVAGRLVSSFSLLPESPEDAQALANLSVSLVRLYIIRDRRNSPAPQDVFLAGPGFPGANETLDTQLSDSLGRFHFSFGATDSFVELSPDTLLAVSARAGEGPDCPDTLVRYQGRFVRSCRIVVNEPHYVSPDTNLFPRANDILQTGDVAARVRSYALSLKLSLPPNRPPQAGVLAGWDAYVLRRNRPIHVPANEGTAPFAPPESLQGMRVVAHAVTDSFGHARLRRLVKNTGPDDEYVIWASPPRGRQWQAPMTPFRLDFRSPMDGTDTDHAVWNSEWREPVPESDSVIIIRPIQE